MLLQINVCQCLMTIDYDRILAHQEKNNSVQPQFLSRCSHCGSQFMDDIKFVFIILLIWDGITYPTENIIKMYFCLHFWKGSVFMYQLNKQGNVQSQTMSFPHSTDPCHTLTMPNITIKFVKTFLWLDQGSKPDEFAIGENWSSPFYGALPYSSNNAKHHVGQRQVKIFKSLV